METNFMQTPQGETVYNQPKKPPVINRLIGFGIFAAAVVYFVPELREKLRDVAQFLQYEWRNWYDGQHK